MCERVRVNVRVYERTRAWGVCVSARTRGVCVYQRTHAGCVCISARTRGVCVSAHARGGLCEGEHLRTCVCVCVIIKASEPACEISTLPFPS